MKTSLDTLPKDKVREARQILMILAAGAVIVVTSGLVLNAGYPEVHDPIAYRIAIALAGWALVGVMLKSPSLVSKHLHLCFSAYAWSVFALMGWVTANSGNHGTWVMGWYLTATAIQIVYSRLNEIVAFMIFGTATTAILNLPVENSVTPVAWMFSLLLSSGVLTWLALRHRLMLIEELKGLNATILSQSEQLDVERARSFNASKLAALGEVSGGIAHEINNPLTIIQGQAYLLKKQLKANPAHDPASVELCDQMMSTISRIAKIIKGIRNFSRDGSADAFERVEAAKIVGDSLALFQEKMASMGIEVGTSVESDAHVFCQEIQISQVFVNLLSNAQHVAAAADRKWIRIRVVEAGDFVDVEFENSGAPIPAEVREKLFQPFFTTKKVGEGTGLGLSISRGIAQAHKGDLFLKEDAPHTTFVVRLPKADAQERKDAS